MGIDVGPSETDLIRCQVVIKSGETFVSNGHRYRARCDITASMLDSINGGDTSGKFVELLLQ